MFTKESLVFVGSIELQYIPPHHSYIIPRELETSGKVLFHPKHKKFLWLISLVISPMVLVIVPFLPSLPMSHCHYQVLFSDLSSLGASLLSPILRSSDTESIKSDGDAPATKRRRLSVSSQEMLEQLVHRASPLPLVTSPRDRRLHPSPPQGQQHGTGPYTRRQRNLSNRWTDRQALPPRANHHRRRWEEFFSQKTSSATWLMVLVLVLYKGNNCRAKIVNCVNMWSLKCPDLT